MAAATEDTPKIPVEPLATFARAFAVNGAHIGWLFGAGTSASAGVPTAGQLLDEFKATLYASELDLDRAKVTMADPLVADRVRRYFDDAHGLPAYNSPEEYAVAFERTYPDPAVRRQWLDRWLALGRPSYGHQVVAALMAAGHLRWLATTNFDDLPERAYEQLRATDDGLRRLTIAAIDNAERAARAIREDDWPLLIKLHGDIASERLKNTTAELQAQDETLRRAVLDASRQYGFAIVGYSGRDKSVMQALADAVDVERAFPHGLAWLTRDPAASLPAVHQLINHARDRGVNARFVEAANFDEVFGVLARHVELPASLGDRLHAAKSVPRVQLVPLPTVESGRFPALRLNALPVLDYPRSALRIRCKRPVPAELHRLLRAVNMPGIGKASGRDVLAFGVPEGWRRALADFVPEHIEAIDIGPGVENANPVTLGLLYEAVVSALAHDRPLRPIYGRRSHRLAVRLDDGPAVPKLLEPLAAAYGSPLTGFVRGAQWSEGVRLRLEWRLGRLWLLYEPWTFVRDPHRRRPEQPDRAFSKFTPPSPIDAWVKERWAKRRNEVWAAALGAWADVLVEGPTATFVALGLGDPQAVDAHFTIASQTAFSLPAAAGASS